MTEYCGGGDLKLMLRQDGPLPPAVIQSIGHKITSGLRHIHSHGIIVCQLTPSKIMLTGSSITISDLGYSVHVLGAEPRLSSEEAAYLRSTRYLYLAPEVVRARDVVASFTLASDFWALGCMLFEMATGRLPFGSKSLEEHANVGCSRWMHMT